MSLSGEGTLAKIAIPSLSTRNALTFHQTAKAMFVFVWIGLAPGLVWLGARLGKQAKNLAPVRG